MRNEARRWQVLQALRGEARLRGQSEKALFPDEGMTGRRKPEDGEHELLEADQVRQGADEKKSRGIQSDDYFEQRDREVSSLQ